MERVEKNINHMEHAFTLIIAALQHELEKRPTYEEIQTNIVAKMDEAEDHDNNTKQSKG